MSKNATFNTIYSRLGYKEKDFTVIGTVVMTQACLSFVLNATFLVVLARNRELVKRKRITYHVANLAMADTMVGLSLFCYEIVDHDYIVLGVVYDAAGRASFSAILLMAIERAVVITKPYTWKNILTIKRILLAILSIWITVLSLAVIEYYYFCSLFQFNNNIVLLFIWLLVVLVYMFIAWRLKVERQRSAAISQNQEAARRLYNKACALSVFLAIIVFVTAGPCQVSNVILLSCSRSYLNCVITPFMLYTGTCLYTFSLLNFIINPVIYIWRVGTYRKAFWRMFKTNVNLWN